MSEKAAQTFIQFLEVVAALRHPETGCPWDLEQDHLSLRPYLIEEAYEVLEAIESGDDKELCSELGDVLLQVVLHSQLASERGVFSIADVVQAVSEKMVRRHPHVFGNAQAKTSQEVLKNWEALKQKEREALGADSATDKKESSQLSGVPKALPALIRGQRLGEKAAKVSFDWSSMAGVWAKVQEEFLELEAEVKPLLQETKIKNPKDLRDTPVAHELGDMLLSLTQLARWMGLSAEDCLRAANERFRERFHVVESQATRALTEYTPEELEGMWQKAKESLEK